MRIATRVFLLLVLIVGFFGFFALFPAGAKDQILEELRSGQHFDRAKLYQAGPKVLSDALAGKIGDIALLGRYFRNGERGFPENVTIANRLASLAYQKGHWSSAMDLARDAAEHGDHREALKLYIIVFLVADETEYAMSRENSYFYMRAPTMTHLAYAEIRILLKLKKIPKSEYEAIGTSARQEAIERGFFRDCVEKAKKFCGPEKEDMDKANLDCRMDAEKICFQKGK